MNKTFYAILGAMITFGLAACGAGSSTSIPNPPSSIYTWGSGSGVSTSGNFGGTGCVDFESSVTTCTCTLSFDSTSCSLTFTFNELSNPPVTLQLNPDSFPSPITESTSGDCTTNSASQINGCRFQFSIPADSVESASATTAIQLTGSAGTQTIINLVINANL